MFFDGDVKKIIELLPAKSVLVVNKGQLMASGLKVVASSTNRSDYLKCLEVCRSRFDAANVLGVAIAADLPKNSLQKIANASIEPSLGFRMLQIYFFQIYHLPWVFIDLRPRYFSVLSDATLEWYPSSLRYDFDKDFILGIRMLYDGFYLGNREMFTKALENISLIPKSSTKVQKEAIAQVFYEHFGQGQSKPMKFSLDQLRNSFDKIFETLLSNKITIKPSFAYLGAMLTTLYTTLEKVDGEIDVREAYLSISKTLSAK
jgi:predicted unusual protein kinase regulating ubiquinone biosynthesis (AarF/ABC1/UbiB family)